jgi:hypothetical protein
MVSGTLQCLGSCQHLKERFGAGYQVDISTSSQSSREATLAHIQSDENGPLHGSSVEEEHAGYFRLRVRNDVDLGEAFTYLEGMKRDEMILDYALSQSTLEQIFINFAKEQEEEKGASGIKNRNTNAVIESSSVGGAAVVEQIPDIMREIAPESEGADL